MLFYLFQTQQPRGISWVVWSLAALFFLTGVALAIYFFRRLRKSDKELEEDWSLSQRSLFADGGPPRAESQTGADLPAQTAGVKSAARETLPLSESPEFTSTSDAVEASSNYEEHTYAAEPEAEIEQPQAASELPSHPESRQKPRIEQRQTEVLSSAPSEPPTDAARQLDKTVALDDTIWGVLAEERPSSVSPNSVREAAQPPAPENRAGRELFEPPRIEPIVSREPFEAPRIEPLTPRKQPATDRPTQPLRSTRDTEAHPVSGLPVHGSERERESRTVTQPGSHLQVATESASERRAAGSVLGLPAESSDKPMVYGEAARSIREIGIGSLSNYGKEADAGVGHGGTIALAIMILLVAGAVLAYLFIPSVHARVDAVVARMRGQTQAEPQAPVERIRAQVYPVRYPDVSKNMVKPKGSVINISEETLEGLEVEVSLRRNDAAPETRKVAVTPAPLAPNQQGRYEFEYDGRQYTGYTITRLLDKNGEEVKFIAPSQGR